MSVGSPVWDVVVGILGRLELTDARLIPHDQREQGRSYTFAENHLKLKTKSQKESIRSVRVQVA